MQSILPRIRETRRRPAFLLPLAITATIVALPLFGCSGGAHLRAWNQREAGDPRAALATLQEAHAANPDNVDYLRELGAVWFELGEPDSAAVYLDAALSRGARDSRTFFHLGGIREMREDPAAAIESYRRARSAALTADGRRLADGRVRVLQRTITVRSLRSAVRREGIMEVSTAESDAVAIIPFRESDLAPELQGLGRGLAELVRSDLILHKALRVADRERVDVLLQELELADLGTVDAATAPRAGRLLRADVMITGSLSRLRDDRFRVVVTGTRAGSGEAVGGGIERTGSLGMFFNLQKELTLEILENLDVPVSDADRRQVRAHRPTESQAALLAFASGLEYEANALYARAALAYREAVNLDPGFKLAIAAGLEMEAAAAAGGTPQGPGSPGDFIRSVEAAERPRAPRKGTGGD